MHLVWPRLSLAAGQYHSRLLQSTIDSEVIGRTLEVTADGGEGRRAGGVVVLEQGWWWWWCINLFQLLSSPSMLAVTGMVVVVVVVLLLVFLSSCHGPVFILLPPLSSAHFTPTSPQCAGRAVAAVAALYRCAAV